MQINEDNINNRFAGSTSSNDSGVIMMDNSSIYHNKNYQKNYNKENLLNMINNDNNNYQTKINNDNNELKNNNNNNNDNDKSINNINNNEIHIDDLDDVSISNFNRTNSQRSSTIYSSSNVSINSINNHNNNININNHFNINNNNNNNIDDDISTVYDSDSDFIEELGDKIDNNNRNNNNNNGGTIVNIQNAIGLNENELEKNGRVILDQQIIGQNNNINSYNNNNNISVPNCISNNGVNINSLSFSGTNNGVTIGPKFICHDLVIKQYVQKSPKQQFRKINVDGNSSSSSGNNNGIDNLNYVNDDENSNDNSIRKNQNGLDPTNTEKPKLFTIRSKATLITGSIIVLIIVLGAITFASLEMQQKSSGSNIGDGDDSRKHIPINSTIGDELITAGKTLRIISRDEWIAQPPSNELTDLELPSTRVIITHTATEGCTTQAQCTFRVRYIQTFHIESRNWDDIGYNFLVGGDGAVYEGRGWDKQGAHTKGYNVKSIGVAFIGTFNKIMPTDGQLNATKLLILEGIKLGKLSKDYKLYGHRQLIATESPGDALYNIIKDWPHFSTEI